jgi:uncharacterized RDD family membrane protein YckC
MKCPKCQYISFDSGERCRNCGYDFSLAPVEAEAPDLPIHNGNEPIGPFSELSLRESSSLTDDFRSEAESPRIPSPRPITSSFDLPLFRDRSTKQDAPLVDANGPPRAPLAVRRATAPALKPRPRRGAAAAELEDPEPRLALDTAEMPVVPEDASEPTDAAPLLARLAGGLLDLVIVGGIDLAVVYFTLKICDLTFAEILVLPLAPLIAFLLVLNGGYFTIFTAAGGQTIGKMATGTRVIPQALPIGELGRVPFGHAIVRAAAYIVSALPAGLGFVPVLIGPDRRALHDRLADTRVVKA